MTVDFRGSAAQIPPLHGGWARVLEAIVGRPSAARRSPDSADVTTNVLAGKKAGSSRVAELGTPQSIEQVKAFASNYVAKCWKDYARLFPEACLGRGKLATQVPTMVFLRTQAESDNVFGSSSNTAAIVGFVKRDDPTRIYVHTGNLVEYGSPQCGSVHL